VWGRLHRIPLARLGKADEIDWERASVLEEAVDAISPILKITARIARRGIESGEKLGRYRWVVERTQSWLNRDRRLKVRYERREDIHQAFLDLGCALIWRYVQLLC